MQSQRQDIRRIALLFPYADSTMKQETIAELSDENMELFLDVVLDGNKINESNQSGCEPKDVKWYRHWHHDDVESIIALFDKAKAANKLLCKHFPIWIRKLGTRPDLQIQIINLIQPSEMEGFLTHPQLKELSEVIKSTFFWILTNCQKQVIDALFVKMQEALQAFDQFLLKHPDELKKLIEPDLVERHFKCFCRYGYDNPYRSSQDYRKLPDVIFSWDDRDGGWHPYKNLNKILSLLQGATFSLYVGYIFNIQYASVRHGNKKPQLSDETLERLIKACDIKTFLDEDPGHLTHALECMSPAIVCQLITACSPFTVCAAYNNPSAFASDNRKLCEKMVSIMQTPENHTAHDIEEFVTAHQPKENKIESKAQKWMDYLEKVVASHKKDFFYFQLAHLYWQRCQQLKNLGCLKKALDYFLLIQQVDQLAESNVIVVREALSPIQSSQENVTLLFCGQLADINIVLEKIANNQSDKEAYIKRSQYLKAIGWHAFTEAFIKQYTPLSNTDNQEFLVDFCRQKRIFEMAEPLSNDQNVALVCMSSLLRKQVEAEKINRSYDAIITTFFTRALTPLEKLQKKLESVQQAFRAEPKLQEVRVVPM